MGLNDSDAKKQINQMIEFIKMEANEKVEEIRQKTMYQFEELFQAKKRKVEDEYEEEYKLKRKQDLVRKQIELSKVKAKSKFSVMEFRNERMNSVKDDVTKELAKVAKSKQYGDLIKCLIVQGLLNMQEETVVVMCRKEDLSVVQSQMDAAVSLYKKTIKDHTKVDVSMNLSVDTKKFLPAGPDGTERESCCGGVVLSARGGKIISRNTLDARLDLAFNQLAPTLRGILFGVRPAPVNASKSVNPHLKKH